MNSTTSKTAREIAASQYEEAAAKVKENFVVLHATTTPGAVWVNCEANTGSRYAVAIHKMPYASGMVEGGKHLISLLQPWQANVVYTVYPGETVHPPYIIEKLCKGHLHGGDQTAVYLAVNAAIKKATEAGVL